MRRSILALVLGTLLVTGCTPGKKPQEETPPQASAPPAKPASPEAESSQRVIEPPLYRSRSGAITFWVPAHWRGRYRSRIPALGSGPAAAQDAVEFIYLPIDTSLAPEKITAVYVFRPGAWPAARSTREFPPLQEIGRKDGLIYTAYFPPSTPYPPQSQDARTFESLALGPKFTRAALMVR